MIEEKNLILQKKIIPNNYSRPSNFVRNNFPSKSVTVETKTGWDKRAESSSVGSGPTNSGHMQAADSNRSRGGEFKHLTRAEMREKREKGLCFRCDEPYSREHRCKNKQFRMIILEEDEEEEEENDDKPLVGNFHSLQLSLCSMAGLTSTKSWKIKGLLKDRTVIILIDCGASHNFIAPDLVNNMKLEVLDTPSYAVEVGDGHKVRCMGKCPNLLIKLQQMEVIQDYYLFELWGVDMVLGKDWLASLGEVKADFGKLELTIKQGPNVHRLIGDPALSKSELTFGAFMQVFKKEGEGLILQCIGQTSSSQQPLQVPEAVDNLLSEFLEVFADLQGLPPQRKQDHAIHLKEGAEIPNLRPYKYPHYQKTEIERLVQEMLLVGVIRHSISPYSSPIILVRKKDGGWRFCADYRALNKITIPNKFPIPIIEELLDEIGGATIFTKLDLKSGYHQIRMHEGDIEKTTFITHEGHYEFVVMPFGLTNAPSTFQSLMNEVLRPFLRKFVLVFFDDIFIYSKDMLSHVAHLQQVLQVLQTNSLKANKKKCSFGQESLEYLGHVISGQGVAADKSKVDAVNSWPLPKEIKGLRGFLGLTGYYRRFVQGYGKLAKPLTDLLKKDNFKWTEEATTAFNLLKTAMVNLPLLAVPDFSKVFVVEIDASSKGLGAVLMQEDFEIQFKPGQENSVADALSRRDMYSTMSISAVLDKGDWSQEVHDDAKWKRSNLFELFLEGIISSGSMSPFKALYGRDPPTLIKGCSYTSKIEEVNQLLIQRDAILTELYQNLMKAQNQMTVQANKHRREVQFEEGDWVYLKIQPYKLKSLASRSCVKLSPRFYGPYQIDSRVGLVAYKLVLPPHSKIHPVFHVSLLKKALKPNQQPQPLPPLLTEELELQVQPLEVLQWKKISWVLLRF
nr:transposon Tf2-1 polyprotein [Lupinus angustifolius]